MSKERHNFFEMWYARAQVGEDLRGVVGAVDAVDDSALRGDVESSGIDGIHTRIDEERSPET